MAEPRPLREQIDEAIAAGTPAAAAGLLAELWRQSPDGATASFVCGRFERIRGGLELTGCRLFVLRSFTVEPLVPMLRACAFTGGIDLAVQLGEFNAYAQELLDPGSALYRFEPDVVVLAVTARDLVPDLWERFAALEPGAAAAVDRAAGDLDRWMRIFRDHCPAHLIVHGLQRPSLPAAGILDAQSPAGQVAAIDAINARVAAAARSLNNVYLLDYDGLVARRGAERWHDERLWLTARLPIASTELVHMAREWARFLHPLTGRVAKAVAVDLDNTLWGGVIGEDGLDGIRLGGEHPGAAHRALQQALLDLHARGILLAVCSKNNPAEAEEALAQHPGMLLRPDHFAATCINWNDKAANLREIAEELNIGIDAVAFLDDSPVERQWVRQQLPMVPVIELPDDPMQYAAAVRTCPYFERLAVSEEDRVRGRLYAEQRQRAAAQRSSETIEDFYHSLEMAMEVAEVTPATLARTAQLTQKTNQFNLTTRRYSEQEIAGLAAAAGTRVWTVRVQDRFGDNGIVGVIIASAAEGRCEIDTLLMSCRVIGRTIETAMLAVLGEQARRDGAGRLGGWFLPTRKNMPASDFYERHGFTCTRRSDEGSYWELELAGSSLPVPPWVSVSQISTTMHDEATA